MTPGSDEAVVRGTKVNGPQTGSKVIVKRKGWFRRLIAFVGPAYLVSVGYYGETVAGVHHRIRVPLLVVPSSGTEPAMHPT